MPCRLFAIPALFLAAFLALPPASRAAPLRAGTPRLSLAVEGTFSEPGDGSRGGGVGLRGAWRISDQVSVAAGGAQFRSKSGLWSTASLGLEALLDSTPIAPFFELSMVALGPGPAPGYNFAMRSGAGADWRITQKIAVGLVVRTVTPLQNDLVAVAGTEVALRLVFTPAGFAARSAR